MAYQKIQTVNGPSYFEQTHQGLSAVADPSVLEGLKSEKITTTEPMPTPTFSTSVTPNNMRLPGESIEAMTQRIQSGLSKTSESSAVPGVISTSKPTTYAPQEQQNKVDLTKQQDEQIASLTRQKTIAELQSGIKAFAGVSPERPVMTEAQKSQLSLAQKEHVELQDQQANIVDQKLKLQDELKAFRESEITSGGIPQQALAGRMSEAQTQAQLKLDSLNRQELLVETKLQNRNNTINALQQIQRQDYVDSVAEYNTKFSQAMQLYGVLDKEKTDLKTNAKANLDVVTNALQKQIESKQLTTDTIPQSQIRQIEDYEMQAKLPIGSTMAVLKTLKPKEETLYKNVDNEGNFVAITRTADGKLSAKVLEKVVAPKPGAGQTMSPGQTTTFNSIANQYQKSPLVAANDRTLVLKTISEQLKGDPKNSSLQVSFIYSLIQALDTYQSAVREGEISLIGATQGLGDKLVNLPDKIAQGTILSTAKVNEFIKTAKVLTDSIQTAADKKKAQFGAQAQASGPAVGQAWNEYINSIKPQVYDLSSENTKQLDQLKQEAETQGIDLSGLSPDDWQQILEENQALTK